MTDESPRASDSGADGHEAARAAAVNDIPRLVNIAADHRSAIDGDRGADLLLRRELAFSDDQLSHRMHAALSDPDLDLIVGTYDDVVFGFALVAFETLDDGAVLARVEQFLVEPEARGVGIGEAVMNAVIDQALSRGAIGVDAVALPGDRETKNFFESFGLKARQLVVHRSFTDS